MTEEDERRWGALMVAAQQGDATAYRTLLGEISSLLGNYLRRRLRPEAVDDVLQDVLLALHTSRHTYDPRKPFVPWCFAITKYRLIDSLRRSARRNVEIGLDEAPPLVSSEEGAERIAALRDLDTVFQELPLKQRELLRLVKLEGHSLREAAALTNSTEGAVKVNIHRAMKALRKIFEAHENG